MRAAEAPPGLDEGSIDWQACSSATFAVRQSFRYEYPGPIEDLHQALILAPPDRLDDQRLLFHEIVSRPSARPRYHLDQYGNRICTLVLPYVERELDVAVELRVERWRSAGEPQRSERQADLFLLPSPLTEPTDLLREAAAALSEGATAGACPSGAAALLLARSINTWVHGRLTYTPGVTGTQTPAGEALRLGAGVCQDYAHIMLALCRLAGLPARYVSGHLLGEGAMHAWVQVLLPGDDAAEPRPLWRAFDPTHGREATLSSITIALGRDYGDVSPTRGTFRAPYAGQLARSEKRASVLSVA